jgi:hypothetical protein
VASLAALEAAAFATAEPGTQLVVVVEPTGPAWLPVAAGHLGQGRRPAPVLGPARQEQHHRCRDLGSAAAGRPTGLTAVEFGSPARASLDRRVRAVARLTAEIGRRKTRIRALAQARIPTISTAPRAMTG